MANVVSERIVWSPVLVAGRVQHTLIRTDAAHDDVVLDCRECLEYRFDAAMVAGDWLPLAHAELRGSRVKVAAALDFPVAEMTTAGRVAEASALAEAGADEIDVSCKIPWLGADATASSSTVSARSCGPRRRRRVKVMLELPLLDPVERERAVALAVEAGVAYVKNASSGAVGVATPAEIRFLRDHVPVGVGVKASGGIDTYEVAAGLLDAGADLIGSSAGVAIASAAD